MIKCNVTVCGTVSRQAQMRANKEGTQFASFGINIVIPENQELTRQLKSVWPRPVTTYLSYHQFKLGLALK